MSSVSKVVDEVCMVRMEATVANAQAESVKETLRAQMASFFVQVEASAKQFTEQMEGRVQALASHACQVSSLYTLHLDLWHAGCRKCAECYVQMTMNCNKNHSSHQRRIPLVKEVAWKPDHNSHRGTRRPHTARTQTAWITVWSASNHNAATTELNASPPRIPIRISDHQNHSFLFPFFSNPII